MAKTWTVNSSVSGRQKEYMADGILRLVEELCTDSGLSLADFAGIPLEQLIILDNHPRHYRLNSRRVVNWTVRKLNQRLNQELFLRLIAEMRSR